MLAHLPGDPAAGIRYLYGDPPLLFLQADGNRSAGGRKFHGIGKQIVPHKAQQLAVRADPDSIVDLRFYIEPLLFPDVLIAQQALTDLLAEIIFLGGREDLLVLQLVQPQNIGDQVGQSAGGVPNGSGVFQPFFLGQGGLLEHGGIIAHDGQRGLQFMGHVGNKVCSQGLRAGQLLRHCIEAVDDRVQAVLPIAPGGGDAHTEVALHQLLRRVGDAPDRAVKDAPPSDRVDHRAQQAQQHHVDKGQLGGGLNALLGQSQSHRPGHGGEEQHHAAGDHKGHQQEKYRIVADRFQHPAEGGRLLHRITAL